MNPWEKLHVLTKQNKTKVALSTNSEAFLLLQQLLCFLICTILVPKNIIWKNCKVFIFFPFSLAGHESSNRLNVTLFLIHLRFRHSYFPKQVYLYVHLQGKVMIYFSVFGVFLHMSKYSFFKVTSTSGECHTGRFQKLRFSHIEDRCLFFLSLNLQFSERILQIKSVTDHTRSMNCN